MKLIITRGIPSETFCLYDTDTENIKSIPFENGQENTNCDDTRPAHRPFGITWDADNIYIASRKSLLVYDSDLKWVDKIELLDENTHQIAMAGDKIAVCMTRKDCIGLLDPKSKQIELYHPEKGWGDHPTLDYPTTLEEGQEQYHINSVVYKDGNLYFLMHRPLMLGKLNLAEDKFDLHSGPNMAVLSHGIIFSESENDPYNFQTVKKTGVRVKFNAQFNRNTGERTGRDLTYKNKEYFWRGIAGTVEDPVLSHSKPAKVTADSGIIKGAGLSTGQSLDGPITDIRRIDGQDDAHHNPHPFPYAWE